MAVRLSALRTGRTLLHKNIIFQFVILISVRLSEQQGLVLPEGLGKLKKFTPSCLEHATFELVAYP
jgi:hypothetical protein